MFNWWNCLSIFPWNQQRLAELDENLPANKLIANGVIACKTGTAEFGGEDERGYRKTHGWFAMTVGGIDKLLEDQINVLGEDTQKKSLTVDTIPEEDKDLSSEKQRWLQQIKDHDFPNTLAIVVLVESDENQPFMEGSRDAAPVAYDIWQWMMGTEE